MSDLQIERTNVVSSAIASIGYEPRRSVLEVEFSSGRIFRYLDVPPDAYEDFLAAASKGAWFNRQIRARFIHVAPDPPDAKGS